MEKHNLLLRQLKKYGLEENKIPQSLDQWQKFLERINNTYLEADQDRYLLERSQEVSSREMQQMYIESEKAHEREALLNQRLIDTARQAGMSEVAVNILHNVGNVLNSVNVSSYFLQEKIGKTNLNSSLEKIKNLCVLHKNDFKEYLNKDDRAHSLAQFLIKIADLWEQERTIILSEIESLNKNIGHIKGIVATQRAMSGVSGLIESVDVSNILDEAVAIYAHSFEQQGIHIIRDYKTKENIETDKSKLN